MREVVQNHSSTEQAQWGLGRRPPTSSMVGVEGFPESSTDPLQQDQERPLRGQAMKSVTPRIRFSLAALMGAVAVVAFACAALRSASDLWASAALTLAVSLLFVGMLGVLFCRPQTRAFWSGFELFSWGYLVLVFGPWFNTNVGPQLLSTKLLGYVHEKVHSATAGGGQSAGNGMAILDYDNDGRLDLYVSNYVSNTLNAPAVQFTGAPNKPTVLYRNLGNGQFANVTASALGIFPVSTWENFQRVGHSLLALAIALAGGLLARWIVATRLERT